MDRYTLPGDGGGIGGRLRWSEGCLRLEKKLKEDDLGGESGGAEGSGLCLSFFS